MLEHVFRKAMQHVVRVRTHMPASKGLAAHSLCAHRRAPCRRASGTTTPGVLCGSIGDRAVSPGIGLDTPYW